MSNSWVQLEEGAISLLETRKAPDGPWLTIEPFSVLRARELADGTAGLLPAALVSIEAADEASASLSRRTFKESVTLTVAIIWRHPGSDEDMRHGTTMDAGLYALIQDVLYLLTDETFSDSDWAALTPVRVRNRRVSPVIVVTDVVFTTNRRISRDEMKGLTYDDFISLYGGIDTNNSGITTDIALNMEGVTWTFDGDKAVWTFRGGEADWTLERIL